MDGPAARGGARHGRARGPLLVVVAVVVLALAGAGAATATYGTQTVFTSKAAPEARELSGLIASPSQANWYWAQSDVWKTYDVFKACAGLEGSELSICQQVQRTRLWALRLDPVTHQLLEVRSFALAQPEWALDPFVAQNNDWEDLGLGPKRTSQGGATVRNLLIAATGNAQQNRVLGVDGRDITCDSRRLIELAEPDLSDPAATTWTPWKLYDVKNFVGLRKIQDCNAETLVTGEDASGSPRAYLVTKSGQKILSRSLETSTGRDPEQPWVPPGTGTAYDPTVSYVGVVRGSTGLKLTAGATDGSHLALLAAGQPCRILSWDLGDVGTAMTLTTAEPTVSPFGCTKGEGLTYVPGTKDLALVGDTGTLKTVKYWYLPWQP